MQFCIRVQVIILRQTWQLTLVVLTTILGSAVTWTGYKNIIISLLLLFFLYYIILIIIMIIIIIIYRKKE